MTHTNDRSPSPAARDLPAPLCSKLIRTVPAVDPRTPEERRRRAAEVRARIEAATRRGVRAHIAARAAPRRPPRWLAKAPLALAAALVCHGSAALPPIPSSENPRSQGFLYEAELGGYYSDNRALTDPADDPGFVLLPRLSFVGFRQGGRIEAQVRGQLEYYQWIEDLDTADLRVRLQLGADGAIVPGMLHWVVANYSDVSPTNYFLPEGTGDLQQVNVFVTGPRLHIWPNRVWSGLVEAQYSNTYAEETREFNSHRLISSAWLKRATHPQTSLSFGVERTDVDFINEGPLNPDYHRIDLLGRYSSDFRRAGAEITAGYAQVKFDDGREITGPSGRASVRYDVTENHRVTANVVREYSDTARDMILDGADFQRPRSIRGRPPLQPSIHRVIGGDANWFGRFGRAGVVGTVYARDQIYPYEIPSDPMSHRAEGIVGQLSWRLNESQSLRLESLYERRKYKHDGRVDDDHYIALRFDQRLNERWSLRAGVSRFDPDAHEGGRARWVEHMVSVALVRHGGL